MSDTSQMFLPTCAVHEDLVVQEHLSGGTTTGSHIYVALKAVINEHGRFVKCSCTVTDDARVMAISNVGLHSWLGEGKQLIVSHYTALSTKKYCVARYYR